MGINELIQQAIDDFVEDRLTKGLPDKKPILGFVLERTRKHVQEVISRVVGEDFSVGELDGLCEALDAAPATFATPVLEFIGEDALGHDIIAYRQAVKWMVLVEELKKVIPDNGKIFTPNTIKQADGDLFGALRAALKKEAAGSSNLDWELLRGKLPDDLESRYEFGKTSPEERKRRLEEGAKDTIRKLGLSDVVAGLNKDPKKLAYFLDISGLNISEENKNRIIYVSFSGLRQSRTAPKLDRLLSDCVESIGSVEVISEVPSKTDKGYVTLTISVPDGARHILVRGPWNRDIKVDGQETIIFDVILKPGEENEITFLAYDEDEQIRSDPTMVAVKQTGDAIDQDALVEFLKAFGDKALDSVSSDEEKAVLFRRCIEESVIKHFVSDFSDGEAYVKGLIENQTNAFVIGVFEKVLKFFREIDAQEFPFIREDEHLMFFQKYCVYKLLQSKENDEGSIILANEPGLGKTLTALAATHGDEILTVCPNSAASTWVEEAARFFKEPFFANLAGHSGRRRTSILENTGKRGVLTNVEFMRSKAGQSPSETAQTDRKFGLLNRRRHPELSRVTIVDEAHFLKNNSQQTGGISLLKDDFMLLLTATPFGNSASLCKVMHRIFPDDPRFKSVNAFIKAFPPNDPRALKALHIMVQPHIIRFLKSEVMPTYDPSRPPKKQPFSLPKKNHIDPFQTGFGRFTLTDDQQQAILEMFRNWDAWTENYDHYMPSDRSAREDGIRNSDNRLAKEHAFRQIVNNPKYVGSNDQSPKHQMVAKILEKELSGGNKVLVFCRYHEQIKAYAELLAQWRVKYSTFTGEITRKGYMKDDGGKIKYLVDENDNHVLDSQGHPVVALNRQRSKYMLEIDYERLVFQNDPEVKVCLATYGAGSQSVNFTAADVIIKDDLPEDCIRDYQAEDRIHRINPQNPKAEVRYYSLISEYDETFLDKMKALMIDKTMPYGSTKIVSAYDLWFEQGTLDGVNLRNLAAHRVGFELLNNGISVDPDLVEEEVAFNM